MDRRGQMQMMAATLVRSQVPIMGQWVEGKESSAAWWVEQALNLEPWALRLGGEVDLGCGRAWSIQCRILKSSRP